jgi:glycosyltransferase involved in cell wall biosynthesis
MSKITQYRKKSIEDIKVSIGIPVYNGEKFIQEKLDSLIKQTFNNFEIIISDNASTDNTSNICREYAKKDKRIKYFYQKENIGSWSNFAFVLEKANKEYFLWSAADDIILSTYLEKTINILNSNNNVSCCGTKMELYGDDPKEFENETNDSIIKKINKRMGYMNVFPASGSYENRIKEFIVNLRHNQIFYGVFRTNQIKESFVLEKIIGIDTCIIFNILKFGEIFVIDETLMKVYNQGVSRKGMIGLTQTAEYNLFQTIFPMYPFTKWCGKNLGYSIWIKNIYFFLKMNFLAEISLIIDIIRRIKK